MWRVRSSVPTRLGRRALSRVPILERRRVPRQEADGSVLICPGNEGALVDWSAAGFAVLSNVAVRVGGTYRIRWPVGAARHAVLGVVRWSRLSGTTADSGGDVIPVFRSGFELIDL